MVLKGRFRGFLMSMLAAVSSFCQVAAQSDEIKTYSIFGQQYATVAIQSDELKGAVFYLVSGHGGPDPGAVGTYSGLMVSEDEYAYDVTLRLARRLISQGALVYLITRDANDGIRDETILPLDQDERCYPNQSIPLNQTERLAQRTQAVNSLYKTYRWRFQRVVFIHLDSRSQGENIDVFFYHHPNSRSGRQLAQHVRNTFRSNYAMHQPGRTYHGTVSGRNLYVLRNTRPTALYIELGNIRNPNDQRRFIPKDNREALAKWIAEGLVADFKSR